MCTTWEASAADVVCQSALVAIRLELYFQLCITERGRVDVKASRQVLERHLWLQVGRVAWVAWFVGTLVFGLMGLIKLSSLYETLRFADAVRVVLLSGLSLGSILGPVALGVAWVAILGRWVEEGVWVGLGSCAISGRFWWRSSLVVGACLGMVTASATLGWEPSVKRMLGASAHEVARDSGFAQRWTPLEGGWLWVERQSSGEVSGVRWVSAHGAWSSQRGRVEGSNWVMEGVSRLGPPRGSYMTASTVKMEVREPDRRIGLSERGLGELFEVARRTESSGGDGSYERAVAWKRFFHPLACGLLPMALLPVAAGRRRWWGLAVTGLGYFIVVRLSDHMVQGLGAPLSASLGLLWMMGVASVSWASWRQR